MRGENLPENLFEFTQLGTSPRARGKRMFQPPQSGAQRNIPACAGKTSSVPIGEKNSAEHPRVRGENMMCDAEHIGLDGTSPRARGKLRCFRHLLTILRNIPACAGKTHDTHLLNTLRQEHPRVRGENQYRIRTFAMGHGTSPRARGKLTRF